MIGGLSGPALFDTVGEPATLSLRWHSWKKGVRTFCDRISKQRRALLSHLAGPGVREMFRTIPVETKVTKTISRKRWNYCPFRTEEEHPHGQTSFPAAKPTAIERIHNFVTRLSTEKHGTCIPMMVTHPVLILVQQRLTSVNRD